MDPPVPPRQRLLNWTLDAALVFLVVAVPGLGAVALPAALPTEETAAVAAAAPPPLPDVKLVKAGCDYVGDRAEKRDCYLDALEPVLGTHGVRETFALLETLADMDPFVRAEDHQMAHHLGRAAYLLVGDAPKVIAECPYTMHSGCTHGTVEALLTSTDVLDKTIMPTLCAPLLELAGTFARHQCLHGLGHGLMMALEHRLVDSLEYCDAIGDSHQASSCYDGVFMENLISFQISRGLLLADAFGAHTHEGDAAHHGELRPGDPQWPCNAVATQYQPRCYMMQTSAFLTFTSWDYQAAYRMCDGAPEEHRYICYQSMGRDVSPAVARDPARTLEWCQWGDDAYEDWCVMGAAKEFMTDAGSVEPAWALCLLAPAHLKPRCYQAIGEYMVSLVDDKAQRWVDCGRAEAGFEDDCRSFAQI